MREEAMKGDNTPEKEESYDSEEDLDD